MAADKQADVIFTAGGTGIAHRRGACQNDGRRGGREVVSEGLSQAIERLERVGGGVDRVTDPAQQRAVGRLVGRGRWLGAWRITFSNPVLNSYFLFTAMMFALFVHYENTFGGQGRNWLPF